MQVQIARQIDDISAADWNRLEHQDCPFLRHEFLSALERNGCVGPSHGWLPHHLVVTDEQNQLIGATPLYIKDNSYGEFVFDWSWADAYARAGLRYYPKAVVAVPYTPATGRRMLIAPNVDSNPVRELLLETALEQVGRHQLSSLHLLFTDPTDTQALVERGLQLRLGCQFHWHNPGYRDFQDFLDRFTAQKRKKLRRERRRVREAGIEIEIVHGDEAKDADWQDAHQFYRTTFDRKWGVATLTELFFREVGTTLGDRMVLIFARHHNRRVAGAICLRSDHTLYGRHWGCNADFHSLHFEVCYYQGIEYCIRHGLTHFEPGAQGEHKLGRGFLPTPTWSGHWIADERFRQIIADFVSREARAVQDYMDSLDEHSPYKTDATA